jgi:hypothetical protein
MKNAAAVASSSFRAEERENKCIGSSFRAALWLVRLCDADGSMGANNQARCW